MTDFVGDTCNFDRNWRHTQEAHYLHWTRGEPKNQIQLAFRQHWLTFQELLGADFFGRNVLEVGCGRGSLSAYFADAGWDCTLLDISPAAIEVAKNAFAANGLKASFDIGDCLSLPYPDASFDLIFSIGLLEHFEKIDQVISEQVRVITPGGLFIGYVVPDMPDCIQKDFEWVNNLLRTILPMELISDTEGKTEVYRSDFLSPPYLAEMKIAGLVDCQNDGVYPLPMISHSPSFPFSLLPPAAEASLVSTFQRWLDERQAATGSDPWRCPEGEGQAFLVWGRKP